MSIQQYTLEQMDAFPAGFTYLDGDDHVPVGTVLVTYADHVAAVEAVRNTVIDDAIKAIEAKRKWWQKQADNAATDSIAFHRAQTYANGFESAVAAVEGLRSVPKEEEGTP